jgi:hypothetical protein
MIEKNIRLQPHHARDLLVGRRSDGRRPKYQPPSLGGGFANVGGGGGNGGHDRGGQQHAAQAAAAQAAARNRAAAEAAAAQQAAAQRAMQATIAQAERAEVERQESDRANQLAEARKLMTQPVTVDVPTGKEELIPGSTFPVKIDPYQQSFIEPGSVTTTDFYQEGDYADLVKAPVDVGFQNILREQKIAEDLRQKQQDPDYGQFFRPQPVVEKPSGIMSKIGGGFKKVFGETPLDWVLTLGTAGGSTLARNIRAAKSFKESALAEKFGINKWNLKGSKFKVPGTDTQKEATKKLVKHEPVERDGIQEAITGEDVVTKTANQFAGTEVEGQISSLVQNDLNKALRHYAMMTSKIEAGYAPNRQEMDVYKLLEYYLNQAAPKQQNVAHGGRIDSPLMGGNRYI